MTGGQPATTTFVRAVSASFGQPYTFREDVPSGWALTSLTCTGASEATTDVARALATVTLHEGEAVTCTYTDRPPRDPGLTIRKVTLAGVGSFPITVAGDNGATFTGSATTTVPGTATVATGIPNSVPPGTYTITETLPPPDMAGSWTNVRA